MITLLSSDRDFSGQLDALLELEGAEDETVVEIVRTLLADVKERGDEAVLEHTRRLDQLNCTSMEDLSFDPSVCEQAYTDLPIEQRDALDHAAERIRTYHERQQQESWSYEDEQGNRLGQHVTPLARVGIYVPGGQASYPSSVLMTVIPARVAGVREIVVAMPTPSGVRNPTVLAAFHVGGVSEAYAFGGAQAIGALAYGTQTITGVHKIVGPGGAFVAAAKRQVFGRVGIDIIAGPSEVLIIADGTTPVDWVVLDLFSQAEHDPVAQSILVTPDRAYASAVAARIEELLPEQPRAAIIRESLDRRGAIIVTKDLAEAIDVSNRVAPEHLELALQDPDALLPDIEHAGAIFIGAHSAEVMGDYAAGPSHVLPTYGTARFSSPLGVYDFQKRSSVLRMNPDGLDRLIQTSATLARTEGLEAHAQAAEARLTKASDKVVD
jgi:histidinol dehydrogenase